MYTGRFAPTFYYGTGTQTQFAPPVTQNPAALVPYIAWYKKILKECDPSALKILDYRYLYINKYWPEGLAEKCLANNDLELQFEAGEGNNFARIYLIR